MIRLISILFGLPALMLLLGMPSDERSLSNTVVLKRLAAMIRDRAHVGTVRQSFGSPSWESRSGSKQSIVTLGYEKPEFSLGTIAFDFKKSRLIGIDVSPRSMSVKEAIDEFGPSYEKHRYAFDDCLSDGGEAPIARNPKGNLLYIEYPRKRLYLYVDEATDQVKILTFSVSPIGSLKSLCPPVPPGR